MLAWSIHIGALWLLAAMLAPLLAASQPLKVYGVMREQTQAMVEMYRGIAEEFRLATGENITWLETDMSLTTETRFEQARSGLETGVIDVAAVDTVYIGGMDSSTIASMEEVGFTDREVAEFYAGVLQGYTNTTGKLISLPLFFNFGMLFYRSDLLRKYNFDPPGKEGWTWDEMEHIARTVQNGEQAAGQTQFSGWVWHGKAYEGFTCLFLEVLAGSGGVNFIGPNGTVMVDTPEYVQTIKRMASWVGETEGISPLAALSYQEANVVQRFCESGNAMFARNWPYMISECNLDGRQGQFGVTRMPGLQRGHGKGTMGGNGLVVAAGANKTLAKVFLSLMTSERWQRRQYEIDSRISPRKDVSSDPLLCSNQQIETCLVDLNNIPEIAHLVGPVFAKGTTTVIVNASSGYCLSDGKQATVCDVDTGNSYIVSRPATVAGANYAEVSKAIYTAGNSFLTTFSTGRFASVAEEQEELNRTVPRAVENTNCAVLRALGRSPLPDQCYSVCIDGNFVNKTADACQPCNEGTYLSAIRLRSIERSNTEYSILETWDKHSLSNDEVVMISGTFSSAWGGRALEVGVLSPFTLYLTDKSSGRPVNFSRDEESQIQFRPVFSCIPCMPGHFSSRLAARACDKCQAGRYQPNEGAIHCQLCKAGTYQDGLAQTACIDCSVSFGFNSLTLNSVEGSVRCAFTVDYFGKSAVCMTFAFIVILLLARTCASNIRILDVSWQEGSVVVTTAGSHHIHHRRRDRTEVSLTKTGCPDLDHRWKRLEAHRLGTDRLLLTPLVPDEDWRHAAVDTSTGIIALPRGSSLVHTGVAVPTLVWICIVIGLEAAAVLFWTLRTNTVVMANVLGSAIAVVVAVIDRWYYWKARSPLQTKITRFRDHLRTINPKPKSCERGPGRAVKAGQLNEFFVHFSEYIRKRNMYYLHTNILLPLTAPYSLSFAEVAGPKQADYFVSHYWGFPFANFVEAVRRHAKTVSPDKWFERAYWICSLSNNQWRLTEEVSSGDWRESSFYKTLNSGQCRATCMILDEKADPLKRSWCLFEVLQTFILQTKESTSSEPLPGHHKDPSFDGLVLCTTSGVLNTGSVGYDVAIAIAKRLSTLSVEEATASYEEDKKMIDELVMTYGGFAGMNEYVRSNIRGVLGTVRSHFESDYSTLDQALGDSPVVDEALVDAILEAHEELEKAPPGSKPDVVSAMKSSSPDLVLEIHPSGAAFENRSDPPFASTIVGL